MDMLDALFSLFGTDDQNESRPSPDDPEPSSTAEEQFAEQIAAEFSIESTTLLRRILEGLDLDRECIRDAVRQVFREQDALSGYPRVQTAVTPNAKRRIVTAVRKKIEAQALRQRIGRLESELHWKEHEARMAEMEVASWLKVQDDAEEYALDPLSMEVREVPYDPYEELLAVATRLSELDSSSLRVIAEESLLPSELRPRAEKISQHSEVDAHTYLTELARGLLTLRPKNRIRAVRGACMSKAPEHPSSEDPPEVVERLEGFRVKAHGGREELWYS